VQRWVLSSLAVTTILHLSLGLVVAALFMDDSRFGAQVGLNIIAGALGVVAVASGLAIHGRRVLSFWLTLGTLPAVTGLALLATSR
jgi:ribose/xylose/arabinose/galactoside ABC-type transport system permease subunit